MAPEPRKKKKRARVPPAKTSATEEQGEKDIFRIDKLPDVENLRYDSVYSGSVSVYRRKFDCLGLKPNQQLKWTDGRSKLNRKKKRLEVEGRYFKDLGRVVESTIELAIPGSRTSFVSSDFIKISNCPVTSKLDKPSESLTAERHMSQMTGEYNRSLLEDPHNISLWLEFLSFQDQLLEWGNLPGEASASAGHKQRALLERKVSIFERALEQNPTSEELLVGHMTLVQQTWPNEKLVRKWKEIVFVHPNRPRLWLGYIQFCQTNFSAFGTSSLISLYKKCITTLSAVYSGTLLSHPPLPDTASYLLAIFSLFCHFLRQVGLTERSVACYQALVEFNLCTPSEFADDKSLKEFFETFWDSGCPRFGEVEALGWRNWMKKNTGQSTEVVELGAVPYTLFGKTVKTPTNQEDEDAELISGLSLTEAWLKLEDYRMVQNCLPWQPDLASDQTEEECTDPDRMVTYDDISQTLFRFTDANLKVKLVLSFLNFLGAPVGSPFQSLISSTTNLESLCDISTPPLLRTMEDSASVGSTTCGLGTTAPPSSENSLSDFATFVSSQVLSAFSVPASLTVTPIVCNLLCNVCNHSLSLLPSVEDQTRVVKVWTSFLFQQLSNAAASKSSAPKKEMKFEIRGLQKLFKALLRLEQHRNNLSLWNSYALFEYSVGNFQDTKTLYESLLARYPVPSAMLCCTLCECFMGMRPCLWEGAELDTPLCLRTLVGLTERKTCPVSDSISPARILKARSCFIQMAASSNYSNWEEMSKGACYGYFEYLTRGVKEACSVFEKWVDKLKLILKEADDTKRTDTPCFLREIYWKWVQLVEHHSLHHPVQPALLRRVVGGALETFPSEGRFLAVFVRSEKQTFISGRMRRHFDAVAPTAESAIPWLFAVAAELDRYCHVTRQLGAQLEETSVGTMYRVLSLIARAVGADNARHCPLLWRVHMAIQVSRLNRAFAYDVTA